MLSHLKIKVGKYGLLVTSGSKQIDDDDGNEDMWVFSHDLPLPQLPTRILKDLGCTIQFTLYVYTLPLMLKEPRLGKD